MSKTRGEMQVDAHVANLAVLLKRLEPKQLRRALKGTLRKEAMRMRRTAQKNLRGATTSAGKKIHNAAILAKGIRGGARKDFSGYYVSVSFKHNRYGYYKEGRHGKEGFPALFYLEEGTGERKTDKGQRRGKLAPLHYLKNAEVDIPASQQRILTELAGQATKIINRYGK